MFLLNDQNWGKSYKLLNWPTVKSNSLTANNFHGNDDQKLIKFALPHLSAQMYSTIAVKPVVVETWGIIVTTKRLGKEMLFVSFS